MFKASIFSVIVVFLLPVCASAQTDSSHELLKKAEQYEEYANYDMAYWCYKEYLNTHQNDLAVMVLCARTSLVLGKEADAFEMYNQVLQLDDSNVSAHLFMGMYHFLKGEDARKKLVDEYMKYKRPTKVQRSNYVTQLESIFRQSYSKSKDHLTRALMKFPSNEARNTLEKIQSVEQELVKGH